MTRASLLALLLLAPLADAQDWPHWRGPSYDGSSEVTGLPATFSKEENVLWMVSLPGAAASTPIVVGDRVFVTSVEEDAELLLALCFDAKSGEELWADAAGSGYRPKSGGKLTSLHPRSNYASPSPVADDERVVFFFGNGDLVAYSHEGDRLWERNLQADYGDFAFQWTFSASPTLWNGSLYLPILQRDEPVGGNGKAGAPSFLLAIDPANGKTRWKHVRPSDAVRESLESYATPIPHVGEDGRAELLVVGGDVITGHDPATGEELWRWGTWNEGHREPWWRLVPSPVVGAGLVLACGPKRAPVFAVELGGKGTLPDDAVAWRSEGRRNPVTTDVPTPLFYDGDFFVLSDLEAALTRVDAETGEQVWSIDLPREKFWRASPTGADGRVYVMDHGGNVLVVDARSGEVVHRAAMGEEDADGIRSSVVAAQKSLFVRTNEHLYRIGAPSR